MVFRDNLLGDDGGIIGNLFNNTEMATPENLSSFKNPILFLMLILLSSCAQKTTSSQNPVPSQAVFATVVDYSELDGCTYLLELADGVKLQPVNLSDEFKRKGLKLFITYKFQDGMSTCMAGRMVSLTSAVIAKEDNR